MTIPHPSAASLRRRADSMHPANVDHTDEYDAYQDHHEAHAKARAARNKATNKEEAKTNYLLTMLAVMEREREEKEAQEKAASASATTRPPPSVQSSQPLRNKSTRSMDPPASSLNFQFPSVYNPSSRPEESTSAPSNPPSTIDPSTPFRFKLPNATTPASDSHASFRAPARSQHSHRTDVSSPFGPLSRTNGSKNQSSSSSPFSFTTPASNKSASRATNGATLRPSRSSRMDASASTEASARASSKVSLDSSTPQPKAPQKIEEDTKEESDEDDDDDDEIDEDSTDEDDEDENKAPPKPIPDSMSFTQDFSARPPENLSPPSVPAFQAETHHFPSMSAPFIEPYIPPAQFEPQYEYPSTVAFDADDYMDTYPDAWEHTDVEMGDVFPTHELDPFAMDTSESRAVGWGFLNANSNWQRNQHKNQHADHLWEQHHEQDRKAEPQPSSATRTLFLLSPKIPQPRMSPQKLVIRLAALHSF